MPRPLPGSHGDPAHPQIPFHRPNFVETAVRASLPVFAGWHDEAEGVCTIVIETNQTCESDCDEYGTFDC